MIVIRQFDIPYEETVAAETHKYQSPAVIFTAKALLQNTQLISAETPFCGVSDATWGWCEEDDIYNLINSQTHYE
jgi:hypothetical protein